MNRCLDEETIQCLLDGELRAPARRSAEAHLEECASCLEASREAEREEALLSSFFATQPSAAVPTARLWDAICTAVSGEGSIARCKG